MFGRKKIDQPKPGIYGERNYSLTVESEDYKAFSLPKFPEAEILGRIEQRTELLRGKIGDGELDSANVDLICTAYTNLLEELDAEVESWKSQCEIGLKELASSLRKEYESRKEALEAAEEQAEKYGPASAK